ncbi:hypothetical protein [Planctopirus ephydatiae]|uniref:hypothetical protein n=1 Tax=Planctopirus ephydatiae TaxID=2528019 RepID=UPI00119DB468|nr:hypothetical protein [Planctopirus ephydatiae]
MEVDQGEGTGSLSDLMQAAKQQNDLALGAFKKSVEHLWYMGKLLSEAKAKHRVLKKEKGKDQPNWNVVLQQFGISVASDNRAQRVYENCPVLEQISGLSITQAYEAAGIPKTASKTNPSVASPVTTEEAAAATNSDSSGDNSGVASPDTDEEVADEDLSEDDDDQVDERTYVEMLRDIATNMDLLREAHHTEDLSGEEINAVLSKVELIAQYALEIKMRLEEGIDAAA